ncbi:hypothetical protein [Pseudomonas grimontii]|jgi:hypothetical protein|uniref:hypothetical protein n=1 Tax=Pseudomonas grimontii TaxID=129847 RepID=UPI00216A9BD5|nr:hypothetical protein [Pseudomonas grimontii]MCS3510061.1 hypothetical protein [Pseudomonas grimontii]
MYEELNLVDLLSITAPTMSDAFKLAISSPETSHQEKLMLALLSQCCEHLDTLGLASGLWVCPLGTGVGFSANRKSGA